MRDIPERMQAQQAMEKARNAALESERVKSDFLASMSHEIRTPLNAVLGMTEIALHSSSSVEIRACLERIAHNGDALLGLLNGVLNFSKLNVGQLELEERSFELGALVGSVLRGAYRSQRGRDEKLMLRAWF